MSPDQIDEPDRYRDRLGLASSTGEPGPKRPIKGTAANRQVRRSGCDHLRRPKMPHDVFDTQTGGMPLIVKGTDALHAVIRLDGGASLDMVPRRACYRDVPSEAYVLNPKPSSPLISIETIEPCRICSANFACATLTSPTASAFRRCANILQSTATRTIGISRILPLGRSAAQRWCSRRPLRSRPRAGFRRRISASGAKSISSRSSGLHAS